MSSLRTGLQGLRKKLYFLIFFLPLFPVGIKYFFQSEYQDLQVSNTPNITKKVENSEQLQNKIRLHLIFSLDLAVRAERALWKETLSYTNAYGRVPDVFGVLADLYRIRIPVANSKKLIIEARTERSLFFREENPLILGDRILIDQNFNLQSNFKLPAPPKEYLAVLAQTVLGKIYRNQFLMPSRTELDLMEGVYKNYFRYEIRTISPQKDKTTAESFGGRTLVAIGIKEPIKEESIELLDLNDAAQNQNNLFEWVYENRQLTLLEELAKAELEKIYFSQKIFFDHTGSYASSFGSLLPQWMSLQNLESKYSLLHIEELGLDPTFGYFSEISCHDDAKIDLHSKISGFYRDRIWTINGYGQIGVFSQDLRALNQIENAKKIIQGDLTIDPASLLSDKIIHENMNRALAGFESERLSPENKNVAVKPKIKKQIPLLIDQLPENASEFSIEALENLKNPE